MHEGRLTKCPVHLEESKIRRAVHIRSERDTYHKTEERDDEAESYRYSRRHRECISRTDVCRAHTTAVTSGYSELPSVLVRRHYDQFPGTRVAFDEWNGLRTAFEDKERTRTTQVRARVGLGW